MVIGFVVIYLFLARKVDQTDYSANLNNRKESRIASTINSAKSGIISLRKKSKIINLYKSLNKSDREDVLKKLTELDIKK